MEEAELPSDSAVAAASFTSFGIKKENRVAGFRLIDLVSTERGAPAPRCPEASRRCFDPGFESDSKSLGLFE
jgi:hypothetical protein